MIPLTDIVPKLIALKESKQLNQNQIDETFQRYIPAMQHALSEIVNRAMTELKEELVNK